jgi:hypothetical protein
MINGRTGWNLSRAQMDFIMNTALAILWLTALARLLPWP